MVGPASTLHAAESLSVDEFRALQLERLRSVEA